MSDKNQTTEDGPIIALFESGLSPLDVTNKGYPAKDVMKTWDRWAGKAMAANKRMEARKR